MVSHFAPLFNFNFIGIIALYSPPSDSPECVFLSPYLNRLRNGVELAPNDRLTMDSEGSSFRLLFKEVTKEDAGTYECIISNASGECTSQATLVVEGKSHISSIITSDQSLNHGRFFVQNPRRRRKKRKRARGGHLCCPSLQPCHWINLSLKNSIRTLWSSHGSLPHCLTMPCLSESSKLFQKSPESLSIMQCLLMRHLFL